MKLAVFDDVEAMTKASETFLALLGGKRVETISDPSEWMACGHHVSQAHKRADGKRQCAPCNAAHNRAKRQAFSEARRAG